MHPKIHSVMIFLVYFLVPLGIISVYYFHIARTLVRSAHNMPGEVSEHTKRQICRCSSVSLSALSDRARCERERGVLWGFLVKCASSQGLSGSRPYNNLTNANHGLYSGHYADGGSTGWLEVVELMPGLSLCKPFKNKQNQKVEDVEEEKEEKWNTEKEEKWNTEKEEKEEKWNTEKEEKEEKWNT
ncbi:unnamed protein product [Boreogadus saida]